MLKGYSRCLPLSIRNQRNNDQSDSVVPQTPPPVYSPLPPKLTSLPPSQLPTIPQNTSPTSPPSSTQRPALPRYQSVDGDIIEWRRARDLHHNPRLQNSNIISRREFPKFNLYLSFKAFVFTLFINIIIS